MKHLLLVDLSHIFWTSWHATADQEVSAAYDATISKVAKLRQGYDHTVICCDSPPYKRAELLPTYKANRAASPPLAREQLRRVKDRLRADGLLLWEVAGYEADDLLCAASTQALSAGHTVRVPRYGPGTVTAAAVESFATAQSEGTVQVIAPSTANVAPPEVVPSVGVSVSRLLPSQ